MAPALFISDLHIDASRPAIIEQFFYRCTVGAQKNGEIPKEQPAEDIARMLLGLLAGLRLLARVRPDAKLLNGMVRPALAALNLVLPRGRGA